MDIKVQGINGNKYGSDKLYYHFTDGVYSFSKDLSWHEFYTVFTKDSHCKMGQYSEEIDVAVPARFAGMQAEAKRVAQAALDMDYDPGLWWSKLVHRPRGVMFF